MVRKVIAYVALSICSLSANAQVGEIREVIESWENGGKNTVVGELLTVLSVSGGYRYERSDGSTIWSNASQYNNKTILYGTAPPGDGSGTGGDSNGSTGGTTTTTTTTDGDVSVTVNVTTPEVNIPEVDLTEITSLISQLDTNDDYDELLSIVQVLETNSDYLTTEQKQQLIDINQKLLEIKQNLTSDLSDLQTKSQKNLDYLEELNATYYQLDRDNDVPMLTKIFDELEILEEKNNQNLINIYDRQEDIAGSIADRETEIMRMAEIADIETSLRIIETEVKELRGEYIDENGTQTGEYATLKDIVDAVNRLGADDNQSDFNATQQDTDTALAGLSDIETGLDVNIAAATAQTDLFIDWDFGKGLQSYNLFDIGSSTGVALPSLSDIASYIKNFLLIVTTFIFFFAMKSILAETLQTIVRSNESNAVTNYSAFGTSVGALVVKAAKTGIFVVAIVGIIVTLNTATSEAGIMGASGTGQGSLTDLISSTAAGNGFMETSWGWFLLFVPLATILSCVGTYYSTRVGLLITIFVMNRSMRTAS